MATFHWSILLYVIHITMTESSVERIVIQIPPKTLLKTEMIHKWLKIFNFTEYSKDLRADYIGKWPRN